MYVGTEKLRSWILSAERRWYEGREQVRKYSHVWKEFSEGVKDMKGNDTLRN